MLPDGSRVRKGFLLRGGALDKLSDADRALLVEQYRLRHIFDFRTDLETSLYPDREVEGADRIWLPAIDQSTESLARSSLPQEAYQNLGPWLVQNSTNLFVQDVTRRFYIDLVMNEYTQLQYAAFLAGVVNTRDGAVFWHCSQGKDRTGLAAAFLLSALGADRELILEDYMISMDFYREELEFYESQVATEAEKEVIRTYIAINPRYFTAALDLIDHKWGSLLSYVQDALLLQDSDIEILRSRYLEK
ncbi:MAG: tyrosine-protein phosphatase [Bacteroidales bacterium]|nr:tyrosine-protein phosphatase [Bacteroidales bacterium]